MTLPPIWRSSRREWAMAARVARLGARVGCECYGLAAVAFPDQLEAGQGEQLVHLVDLVAGGHDRGGVAARRYRRGLLAELLAQAAKDAVDLAGEPVDHARLDRFLRALADRVPRLLHVHPRQPRRPRRQRLQRDLDPGRDHAAEVLAAARHDVVVDR